MTINRGEIWWANLPHPTGSGPGFRHPVVIAQADTFNRSAIRTVIAAVVTSNTKLAAAPGNVYLSKRRVNPRSTEGAGKGHLEGTGIEPVVHSTQNHRSLKVRIPVGYIDEIQVAGSGTVEAKQR